MVENGDINLLRSKFFAGQIGMDANGTKGKKGKLKEVGQREKHWKSKEVC